MKKQCIICHQRRERDQFLGKGVEDICTFCADDFQDEIEAALLTEQAMVKGYHQPVTRVSLIASTTEGKRNGKKAA